MKIAKYTVKGLTLIHILLWIVFLIWGIIEACSYTDTGKSGLERAMEQGSIIVPVITAGIGAVTAGMLALSVFRFLRPGRTKLRTAALVTCIADNVLLYLTLYLVYCVNRDIAILFPFLWLICSIVCGMLLFADS